MLMKMPPIFIAVSYTHLDVYKRQRLSCISGDSLVLTNYGEIPIRELEYFSDEDDIRVMTP